MTDWKALRAFVDGEISEEEFDRANRIADPRRIVRLAPVPARGSLTVVEHIGEGTFTFDEARVRLEHAERQALVSVDGETMLRHFRHPRALNACVLDFLLRAENRWMIPEAWKRPAFIGFWGTIYRNEALANVVVRGFGWSNGRWVETARAIHEDRWNVFYPAAVRTDIG